MADEMKKKCQSSREDDASPGDLRALVAERTGELKAVNRKLQGEIAERLRVEEALRESEARYRYIFDNALISLWEEDVSEVRAAIDELKAKGVEDFRAYFNDHPEFVIWALKAVKVKDVNPAALQLYEARDKEELLGGLDRVFMPESIPVFQKVLTAIAEGTTYFESETVNKTLPGEKLYVLVKAAIPAEKEKFDNMLVSIVDISDRKRAEDSLRESERRFRSIVEYSHEGIVIVDDDFNLVYVNDEFCRMVGYAGEEIMGRDFRELLAEESVEMVTDRYIRRQRGEDVPRRYTFFMMRKDGEKRQIEISSNVIPDEPGRLRTIAQLLDITERKKEEAQLLQAQKMEAVGTLAGGLAHDFNNLLMGIIGNVSMMMLDCDVSDPHYERLKNIEHFAQNGAELTEQLLAFGRSGKHEVVTTDLNELIEKNSEMFARTKKEIKIFRELQKDLWIMEADRGQLEQVLLNLYVNAWQAMPTGGELYIETENVYLDWDQVEPFQLGPGKYVKVSIADTGEGMDKETRKRIFEPFFTTRGMGRGTGLGLASVYGIISNHGGMIQVESEKGVGTTFNIYLPASTQRVKSEKSSLGDIRECTETVLLVDDEEMILEVGRDMLEKLGCEVLTALSGKQAIEMYRQKRERVQLIILDLVMPGESGEWTFEELKKIAPDGKVLLSSGYGIDDQAAAILARGASGFIQKPFTMKELSHKIKEVLNKPEK